MGKVENTLKVLEVQKAVRFTSIFFGNGFKFSILFVLSKAHGDEKYPPICPGKLPVGGNGEKTSTAEKSPFNDRGCF